jgi:hypothetical protein
MVTTPSTGVGEIVTTPSTGVGVRVLTLVGVGALAVGSVVFVGIQAGANNRMIINKITVLCSMVFIMHFLLVG